MARQSENTRQLVQWLETTFQYDDGRIGRRWTEKYSVSNLREMAETQFGMAINDKALGTAVKIAFPLVKRQHAKGPNFYYGLKLKINEAVPDTGSHRSEHIISGYQPSAKKRYCDIGLQIMLDKEYASVATQATESSAFEYIPKLLSGIPKDRLLNRELLSSIEGEDLILGEGTFAKVKIMQYKKFNVAVKEYKERPEFTLKNIRERAIREAKILINITPNQSIPILFGLIIHSRPFCLIFELCSRHNMSLTLLRLARSNAEGITDKQLSHILTKLAKGLQHIHLNGFIHNDLKLDNVAIIKTQKSDSQRQWTPVILDFGEASSITSAGKRKYNSFHMHVDPLVLSGTNKHSIYSDVYSLGIIVEKMGTAVAVSREVKDMLLEVAIQCKKDTERPDASTVASMLETIYSSI